MAAVSCRAFYIVRWFEVSRVLSASPTLCTTQKYRNETWCRRWRHISHRSFSLTTKPFAPSLSPILTRGMGDSKSGTEKTSGPKKSKQSESSGVTEDEKATAPHVSVTYHRGLPKITVPLPSRNQQCVFILKPITHTVGDFIEMLKHEDRGIDRAILTTPDGIRIASSNTIESLLQEDFRISINDIEYNVSPPLLHKHTMEDVEKLSDVQVLIGQLYESFHVREYHAEMEREVLLELEDIRLELEPLEQNLQEIEATAVRRAKLVIWALLVLMSVQFGCLARLTWWEYSWDIMEPVTYFVTHATSIVCFTYFLLTKQEYILPDVLNRRRLIVLHKKARKAGLDLDLYNTLKEREYELETTLKIIRGPLYEHKMQVEQKRKRRSSSSSSRSPSSSPSPSPSPSPERSVPKKHVLHEKDTIN